MTAPNTQVDSDQEVAQEAAAELRSIADKVAGSVAEAAATTAAVSAQPVPAGARPSPALTAMQELIDQLSEATTATATEVRDAAAQLEEGASVLANTDHAGSAAVAREGEK